MSMMLIPDDREDTLKSEDFWEFRKSKCEDADPQYSARKRKLWKELTLGFLSFSLLTNNFIQCAVLAPVTPTSNILTPETTIFYIAKDVTILIASPFVAVLIDHVGSEILLFAGSIIMFLSTAMLACGKEPLLFFLARSFHGLASTCVETSAYSIVASLFSTSAGKTKGFGIVLEIASFGSYSEASTFLAFLVTNLHQSLYLILAFIPFASGVILCATLAMLKQDEADEYEMNKPRVIPIWKLLVDPYVLICAGSLMAANVPLVIFQKGLQLWAMDDFFPSQNAKNDTAWFLLFSHILGITFVILTTSKYSCYRWLMILGGLVFSGLCCFTSPFADSYEIMEISACGASFGAGIVRAAAMPTFACIVESKNVYVYGSVYAIANMFSAAGYIAAVLLVYLHLSTFGFTALIVGVGLISILYAPLLFYVKRF